jgi:hypothetical protein
MLHAMLARSVRTGQQPLRARNPCAHNTARDARTKCAHRTKTTTRTRFNTKVISYTLLVRYDVWQRNSKRARIIF